MNRKNFYNDYCPILHALNIIGGKWRLPILWSLSDGSLRYNQLKRKLNGITNIMLTRSLQDLEEYGLIKRIQHSEIPLHVEYFLTKNAKKLAPAMLLIQEWGKEQILLENGE
jgi:DNA-binding HxlR family transcriptional regulator